MHKKQLCYYTQKLCYSLQKEAGSSINKNFKKKFHSKLITPTGYANTAKKNMVYTLAIKYAKLEKHIPNTYYSKYGKNVTLGKNSALISFLA